MSNWLSYEAETEEYVIENKTLTGQNQSSEVTSIHMLWLLPQFIIITVAEVMFAVPGMEFSYSQVSETLNYTNYIS